MERVLADTTDTAGPVNGRAAKRDWRDLRLRVLSALVLAPLALLCVVLGGWCFVVLVAAVAFGMGTEWAGLLRLRWRSLRGLVLPVWPVAAVAAALVTGRWAEAAFLLLPATLVLGPAVAAGVVSIGWAALALCWLRLGAPAFGQVGTAGAVVFVVLVVWTSDSAAYLVGRTVGGPKLAPRISPNKTRSGALGGLCGAAVAGMACAALMARPDGMALAPALPRGLIVGMMLGVAAQAGDLAESAFKRRCGAKDSGRLIPGHGGLLDRLDALLAAAPVAALLSLAAPAGSMFWYAGAMGPHGSP